MMIKKIILLFLLAFGYSLTSCSSKEQDDNVLIDNFIRAADVSFLPLIESENTIFYNSSNQPQSVLSTLKNAGCNTIRIRLWKNPKDNTSSLDEVKKLSNRAKQEGFKVWLTVHYSDTWADPASQTMPTSWQNLSFSELKVAVSNYTTFIISEIKPDIIQIGNEINNGFLWPKGNLTTKESQFLELLSSASLAIRNHSSKTKIMLHYAGINSGATWFFNKVNTIDYDYIGLSYYPIWHGKNLNDVAVAINSLSQTYNKKVIIAETSYPFTLNWNDLTNNVVGLEDQIISEYPATEIGQKKFMLALKNTIKSTKNGAGFCYWGGEWIAFRGLQSTNGSSWENQALWNFNNKALPVLEVFNP